MRSFQHISPPFRIFHGSDSLQSLADELDRIKSRRAMIFCGSSLVRRRSELDLIQSAIGDRCSGVYANVRAHSPLALVEEAARELKRVDADAVIAVGGGSAIVTARAATILLAENRDAHELCTSRDASGKLVSPRLLAPKLPQLVIPTTPITAVTKAGSAVFDPATRERLALFDPKTRAQSVFVHPDLLASAPRELVVSASLNTLALAVEGLLSRTGDPLADALLMHALRLMMLHLPNVGLLDDADVRAELLLAAILCGQGTDYTGAGVTIVLGHALGARCGLEIGITNAVLLPHALRFNAQAAPSGLQKVAAAMGLAPSASESCVEQVNGALQAVFDELGLVRRLRDVDLSRDVLPDIAQRALGDWFLRGNPRSVRDAGELQSVLELAW